MPLLIEPISAYKDAGLLGVAVLLFLGNFMLNYGIKKSAADMWAAAQEAKALQDKNSITFDKMCGQLCSLAEVQTEMNRTLTTILANQQVQALNQLGQTNAVNEVIRALVGIIREEVN